MNIGIFDSGVGGLIMTRALVKHLPQYDYVYVGDTKRVPYGNRSHNEVHQFLKEGVAYLFKKKDCKLVIVACNTASARALRQIQKKYLPKYFPDRKVLGVIIPAAEETLKGKRIGILGTVATVKSKTYLVEIQKLNPRAEVFQLAAPSLVTDIEKGDTKAMKESFRKYLAPLLEKKIDTLVLGCTHYPIGKTFVRKIARLGGQVGKKVHVISQDEFIPKKTADYLKRHPEIKSELSKNHTRHIYLTKETKTVDTLAKKWFGQNIKIETVKLG